MPTEEAKNAYRLLQRALWHRHIARPETCEQCGARPEYDRLQGHHDDYTKPLDVRWLCRSCHGRHHGALKRALRMAA